EIKVRNKRNWKSLKKKKQEKKLGIKLASHPGGQGITRALPEAKDTTFGPHPNLAQTWCTLGHQASLKHQASTSSSPSITQAQQAPQVTKHTTLGVAQTWCSLKSPSSNVAQASTKAHVQATSKCGLGV
ncbi:hypothetical protein PIB30_081641, partial [Stylosanthes scabra]|nr:hypothetical protein [Stylosanthes scabra]